MSISYDDSTTWLAKKHSMSRISDTKIYNSVISRVLKCIANYWKSVDATAVISAVTARVGGWLVGRSSALPYALSDSCKTLGRGKKQDASSWVGQMIESLGNCLDDLLLRELILIGFPHRKNVYICSKRVCVWCPCFESLQPPRCPKASYNLQSLVTFILDPFKLKGSFLSLFNTRASHSRPLLRQSESRRVPEEGKGFGWLTTIPEALQQQKRVSLGFKPSEREGRCMSWAYSGILYWNLWGTNHLSAFDWQAPRICLLPIPPDIWALRYQNVPSIIHSPRMSWISESPFAD